MYDDEYNKIEFGGFWSTLAFILVVLLLVLILWPIILVLFIVSWIRDCCEEKRNNKCITREDREEYVESGMKFTKPTKKRKIKAKRKLNRKK